MVVFGDVAQCILLVYRCFIVSRYLHQQERRQHLLKRRYTYIMLHSFSFVTRAIILLTAVHINNSSELVSFLLLPALLQQKNTLFTLAWGHALLLLVNAQSGLSCCTLTNRLMHSLDCPAVQLMHCKQINAVRRGVNEIFALTGFYATYVGRYWRFGTTCLSRLQGLITPYNTAHLKCCRHSSWTTWPSKMARIVCSETSITEYNLNCVMSQKERSSNRCLFSESLSLVTRRRCTFVFETGGIYSDHCV